MLTAEKSLPSPYVGKLVAVTGWMSEDERQELKDALKHHPHIRGQSDFVNQAAEALIANDGIELAQPVRFLTAAQRDKLKIYEAIERERDHLSVAETPAKYSGKAKKKGTK